MTDPLPKLLDAKQIRDETGMTRAAVDKMLRQLPKFQVEGLRKVYVKRADVERYIEEQTAA